MRVCCHQGWRCCLFPNYLGQFYYYAASLLLLQFECRIHSACPSVCNVCIVEKRLTRSRCRLEWWPDEPRQPYIRWRSKSPTGNDNFGGWGDGMSRSGDAAYSQIALVFRIMSMLLTVCRGDDVIDAGTPLHRGASFWRGADRKCGGSDMRSRAVARAHPVDVER